jgi:DNA-binding FadR family transcriptional regulator
MMARTGARGRNARKLPAEAGLVDFTPIDRSSVAERVAKKILDLIRTGNLKAGDQLPPERELAISVGVSRPSVREAMRGLQILGVVKARQGGGAFISSLDVSELLGPLQFLITLDEGNVDFLYDARMLIDREIGRRAALKISESRLNELRRIVELQKGLASDPVGFRVSDMEFHRIIIEACGNPILGRIATSLFVLGLEYRRMASETPGVLQQSIRDHKAITAALAARDQEGAGAAMARHMSGVHASTVRAMKKLA